MESVSGMPERSPCGSFCILFQAAWYVVCFCLFPLKNSAFIGFSSANRLVYVKIRDSIFSPPSFFANAVSLQKNKNDIDMSAFGWYVVILTVAYVIYYGFMLAWD